MISVWSQWKVRRCYEECAMFSTTSRLTGAESAEKILEALSLNDVKIEEIQGVLNDHYDPDKNTVYLSRETYHSKHLAALAVVSHEIGHAIQQKESYLFLRIRQACLPFVYMGSSFSWVLMIIGAIFHVQTVLFLSFTGLISVLLFQLLTLSIEHNANLRARKVLHSMGIVPREDAFQMNKLLRMALFTYVIDAFFILFEWVRFLFILVQKTEKK